MQDDACEDLHLDMTNRPDGQWSEVALDLGRDGVVDAVYTYTYDDRDRVVALDTDQDLRGEFVWNEQQLILETYYDGDEVLVSYHFVYDEVGRRISQQNDDGGHFGFEWDCDGEAR